MSSTEPLLRVDGLVAGYRGSQVLQGVDLEIPPRSVVALLGRNGAGKSTFVMSLMGLVRPHGGRVLFDGTDIAGRRPEWIAKRGIGLVPQGRRVFKELSAEDNLKIAVRKSVHGTWTIDRVYELLPRLAERRTQLAGLMSGGEQQMVAIGRALVGNPRLLLLDEPSDGLAPAILLQLSELMGSLRDEGLTVLVVEQDISLALGMADQVAVLEKGCIKHVSAADEFRSDPGLARELLGV